jgi:uncharacterized protein
MSCVRKRVVFDTSALIPVCLHPDREPAQIFKAAALQCDIYASEETFGELITVLSRAKFDAWSPFERRMVWGRLLRDVLVFVTPERRIGDCRDPKDNKFLEVAVAASAEVIVSSDEHLLQMHPYR